jgi:hypothetical protein
MRQILKTVRLIRTWRGNMFFFDFRPARGLYRDSCKLYLLEIACGSTQSTTRHVTITDNHLNPIHAHDLDRNTGRPEARTILKEIVILAIESALPSRTTIGADLKVRNTLF